MTTARTLPALHDDGFKYAKPYRLFTAADGYDYDEFPHASLVTTRGSHTSYSSLSRLFSSPSVVAADDGLVTLHASVNDEPHPLDGTKYPDHESARRAAYDAGLLARMVYEPREEK